MKQFEEYGRKLFSFKAKQGSLLYPNDKIGTKLEEIKLIEANPNLWGNILAGAFLFLLVLFTSLGCLWGWIEFSYEENYDLIFGIVVAAFLFIKSIGLMYSGFLKLSDTTQRSYIRVDACGVRHREKAGSYTLKLKWEQIESLAIKVFNELHGKSVYLLLLLKDGELKDVDISLLKKPIDNKTSKREYFNTMRTDENQYNELLAVVGKYLNKL